MRVLLWFLVFAVRLGAWEINCPDGCGDPFFDPNAAEITAIFANCIDKLDLDSDYNYWQEGGNRFQIEWSYGLENTAWRTYSFINSEGEPDFEQETWRSFHFRRVFSQGFSVITKKIVDWELYFLTTYPEFLEAYELLSKDLVHGQKCILANLNATIAELKQEKEAMEKVLYENEQKQRNEPLDGRNHKYFSERIKENRESIAAQEKRIKTYNKELSAYIDRFPQKEKALRLANKEIRKAFLEGYEWCIKYHHYQGAYYERGLMYFKEGRFLKAFDDMNEVIELSHQKGEMVLPDPYYYDKGILESELGLFNDAILSLSQAIKENPENKESYFERSVAYFETGNLEQSLSDYLASGYFNTAEENRLQKDDMTSLSFGITAGVIEGVGVGLVEYGPELLRSISGLSHGLWAFCTDPVGASTTFSKTAVQCVEYLKTHTTSEVMQLLVPELKELLQNYDTLENYQKGKLIGRVIGRYGVDIFITAGSAAAIKQYRTLKRANDLMTLEALSTPKNAQKILETAAKRQEHRADWFTRIEMVESQQNKHIRGNHNFNPTRSEWTHPNPEKKIKELAGKGQKVRGEPGQAGYKERVDCGEVIGFYFKEDKKIPTTKAIIHYSEKGAHIVPARPQK